MDLKKRIKISIAVLLLGLLPGIMLCELWGILPFAVLAAITFLVAKHFKQWEIILISSSGYLGILVLYIRAGSAAEKSLSNGHYTASTLTIAFAPVYSIVYMLGGMLIGYLIYLLIVKLKLNKKA